jgi:hypothetical protein
MYRGIARDIVVVQSNPASSASGVEFESRRRCFVHSRAALLVVWSVVSGLGGSAEAGNRVTSMSLPSRRSDAAAIAARARTVADAVARRMAGDAIETPARIAAVAPLVASAQTLAAEANLDAAAAAFDAAIAEGTRALGRIDDPAAFISAHVARATIAFARAEEARAQQLLDTIVRFDPTITLVGDERRPRMEAALEATKARLGERPPLASGDLGDACRDADVVIVARAIEPPAANREAMLELLRFDACVLSATATTERGNDAAIALLAGDVPALDGESSQRRTIMLAGGLSGAAVIVAGAGLATWAYVRYDELRDSCGVTGTCSPSSYEDPRRLSYAGWGLVALGSVVATVSVIYGLRGGGGSRNTPAVTAHGLSWAF